MSVLLLAVMAADWNGFRGGAGDGVALWSRPPVGFSETRNIRWRVSLDGKSWSSPVVAGDRVWMTNATEDGRELSAVCIDLNSGETLFDEVVFEVKEPQEIHAFNSHASPTPTFDAERVYLSWGAYGLAALDRETFARVWLRRDLPCNHWRGPGSSPVVHEDSVLLNYDGYDFQYVVCFDAATGRTRWRTDRPHHFGSDDGDRLKAYATGLVLTPGDGVDVSQFVVPASFGVFSYDVETGEELWRAGTSRFSPASRPVLGRVDGRPQLFVASGFGKGEVVAIDPRPGVEDRVVWTQQKTMPNKPSPVFFEGRLYCVSDKGVLVTLDAATGEVLAQTRLKGNYTASPLLVGGPDGPLLVVADESGRVLMVTATDDPEVVMENAVGDGMLASPAPVEDGLLLRTKGGLIRIGS